MKSKMQMGVVTVKVQVPKGYKPSRLTYKFGVVINGRSESLIEQIKNDYTGAVKKQIEEQNDGLTVSCTADVDLIPVSGFSAQYWEETKQK